MSRCVIISACPVSPELAEALRPDDFIIACDAGYRNCAPLGRRPNIIVGDFDTAPCPEQQDDDIIVLPHVKDDTDTEYAAKLVSEKGFDEVLLLGGLGGRRVEHTLANLCTGLGLEQRGVRTTLLDERSRITYVMPGETRRYPKEKYFFFSAFPMEGRAQGLIGVSIKGVSCNMAGAENKVMRWIEGGDMPKAQIAAEVFDFLCRSILRMIAAAGERTGARQALLAGGVASSTLLRGMLLERAKKTRLGCRLCFARPELSGDNAVGVALLGAEAYRAERRLHG